MHLSREEYIEGLQAEAVNFAKSLLSNSGEYLVAIRNLSCLCHEIGTSSFDEDFKLFSLIDSETDHLPAGEVKAMCSPEWLQKSEEEIQTVQGFYHNELVVACNKILARFSSCA